MRCKKGELAIVKLPAADNHLKLTGKIITTVRVFHNPHGGNAMWEITPFLDCPMGRCYAIADKCLTPIRPGDDPDETLKWAPVPSEKDTVCV